MSCLIGISNPLPILFDTLSLASEFPIRLLSRLVCSEVVTTRGTIINRRSLVYSKALAFVSLFWSWLGIGWGMLIGHCWSTHAIVGHLMGKERRLTIMVGCWLYTNRNGAQLKTLVF